MQKNNVFLVNYDGYDVSIFIKTLAITSTFSVTEYTGNDFKVNQNK
jgi:hypothetical protein